MAEKFNLMELLSQRSKGQQAEEEKAEGQQAESFMPAPEIEREEVLMIDVCDLIPSKDNFYHVDDELKRSIELFGILQPLLVKRPENGKYRVIAGHRRRLAVLSLMNEGKEERRYMPCVFKREDIRDRLAIIMANKFREKTDYEKMLEAIQTEELAKDLKKEYKIPGKVREILAELTGQSEAQLGRYKSVYNNLSPDLMEVFKAGKLPFSVAVEVQTLPEEWQQRALEWYEDKGELTIPDIKALRKELDAETPLPGQIGIFDGQTEENTKEGENGQETAIEKQEAAENEENEAETGRQEETGEEWIEPQPETVQAICYNCNNYEICNEKKSTVTSCNAYVDRKEARKTEEQRYNEEQAAIDRETKKKLRERQQAEKMQHIPSEERKERCIRISPERYEEITSGVLTFLLLKKDNFRNKEEITLLEFQQGRATGRTIEITVCYIWEDYTGLDDDFCIIGFETVAFS